MVLISKQLIFGGLILATTAFAAPLSCTTHARELKTRDTGLDQRKSLPFIENGHSYLATDTQRAHLFGRRRLQGLIASQTL